MSKHNRASSIQVAGTNNMMAESRNANQKLLYPQQSTGEKRASTVLKGAEGTTQNDSDVYQDYLSQTLHSQPQTANLVDENAELEDDMITGDATENSASNIFGNTAKLHNKPKLPPIKGMISLVSRNSVMGKTTRTGMVDDSQAAGYQAVIESIDNSKYSKGGQADKRQIVLNVQSKATNAVAGTVGRPRSKQQIRATTQAIQHRSNKLAPLEVKFQQF